VGVAADGAKRQVAGGMPKAVECGTCATGGMELFGEREALGRELETASELEMAADRTRLAERIYGVFTAKDIRDMGMPPGGNIVPIFHGGNAGKVARNMRAVHGAWLDSPAPWSGLYRMISKDLGVRMSRTAELSATVDPGQAHEAVPTRWVVGTRPDPYKGRSGGLAENARV